MDIGALSSYEFAPYTYRLYQSRLRSVHSQRLERILRIARAHRALFSGRMLEVGCGDLFLLCNLVEAGIRPASFLGCDVFWENSSEVAHANAARLREGGLDVTLLEQKAETLDAADFDLAVLLETIEHLEDEKAVLETVVRALRPGGHLLVSVPVEWGAMFAAKEAARAALNRSIEYSFREYAAAVFGRTDLVKRRIGAHKGYDFRATYAHLRELGMRQVVSEFYPFQAPALAYGAIALMRRA